jgi:protein tyrosine phosphatase (PTP) superfamily phosphohydrolase (DUF442 family)
MIEMSSNEIYNYIKVSEEIITSGQPTADQLRSLAVEGFTTVINLATINPPHSLEDEAGLVQALGMNYYHIPVEWGNPQESDFVTFERIMTHLPPGKTLIHCAANFRVTAFYALYAQSHLGWSAAQGDEFRAAIWEGSNYPVWNEFIARMTKRISAG